jgi:Flp pilus assembly pilin Flp
MTAAVFERLVGLYVAAITRDEEGQTAVEYALVLGLIALVLALALATGLTGALSNTIAKIQAALT